MTQYYLSDVAMDLLKGFASSLKIRYRAKYKTTKYATERQRLTSHTVQNNEIIDSTKSTPSKMPPTSFAREQRRRRRKYKRCIHSRQESFAQAEFAGISG
jgi:hypothetical protein